MCPNIHCQLLLQHLQPVVGTASKLVISSIHMNPSNNTILYAAWNACKDFHVACKAYILLFFLFKSRWSLKIIIRCMQWLFRIHFGLWIKCKRKSTVTHSNQSEFRLLKSDKFWMGLQCVLYIDHDASLLAIFYEPGWFFCI